MYKKKPPHNVGVGTEGGDLTPLCARGPSFAESAAVVVARPAVRAHAHTGPSADDTVDDVHETSPYLVETMLDGCQTYA